MHVEDEIVVLNGRLLHRFLLVCPEFAKGAACGFFDTMFMDKNLKAIRQLVRSPKFFENLELAEAYDSIMELGALIGHPICSLV